jgi:hypothetical protein
MSLFGDIFSGLSNNYNANPNNVQVTGQNLQPAINTANANYGQANTGLGSLATALQGQMSGQGPNLANAQFQQANNQNIQTGAGQIASSAGISPALATRNIADQTAAANANAASNSATLRAQSQLDAQNGLAGVLGTQGSLANSNLGIQQGAQASQNNVAANLAGIAAGQAQQNASMNQGLIGGLSAGLMGSTTTAANGSTTTTPGLASLFAKGGQADSDTSNGPFSGNSGFNGSGSNFGFNSVTPNLMNFLTGNPVGTPTPVANNTAPVKINPNQVGTAGNGLGSSIMNAPSGNTGLAMAAAEGGEIPQMPLPFGPSFTPNGQQGLADGGPINFKPGGQVPGEPKYPGQNTVKQDNIPAMLTSKEIVLPLTVTQHP